MNTKLSIIIILIISLPSFGQLQVDIGDDLIICIEDWYPELPTLGGNPTAFGGVTPYTYCWSTEHPFIMGPLWAFDFLNDTTAANPTLQNPVHDSLLFKLIVTDSLGNQAEDSIMILFSNFVYLAVDCIHYILEGDTVKLFANAISDNVPLSFFWSPNYNISDITSPEPLAWPDTNFTYTVMVTDSYGCVASPFECDIYVDPLDIDLIKKPGIESIVFPNPINIRSVIQFHNVEDKCVDLKIYNSNGKLILEFVTQNNSFHIGKVIRENGLYFYTLSSDSKIISSGQFVKK